MFDHFDTCVRDVQVRAAGNFDAVFDASRNSPLAEIGSHKDNPGVDGRWSKFDLNGLAAPVTDALNASRSRDGLLLANETIQR